MKTTEDKKLYMEYRMCKDANCHDCKTCGYYWADGINAGKRSSWTKVETMGAKMEKQFADAVSKAIKKHLNDGTAILDGDKLVPIKSTKPVNKSFRQKIYNTIMYYWAIVMYWINK